MSNIGAFLTIAMLALLMIVLTSFGLAAMGGTDAGVSLTGTIYEQPYNTSRNVSIAAYQFSGYNGLFLGAASLMFMLLIMAGVAYKKMN